MISVLFWKLSCSCSWNRQWNLFILSQDVIPFFQTIFQLFRWCCYYCSLDLHFLRVSQDVSGTQLHFRDAGCASQECFWSPGSRLPGWLAIPLPGFWQTSPVEYFTLWIRSPFWLLTSLIYCLILFPPMLYLLEIYTAGKEPIWVRLGWGTLKVSFKNVSWKGSFCI